MPNIPPLISLTLSDGEEKQVEITSIENNYDNIYPSIKHTKKFHTPCKLSCILIAAFMFSILPMLLTELLRGYCLSQNVFVNIVTCMTAISTVQTMIYPQLVFYLDECINKAVHQSLMGTKARISALLFRKHLVRTKADVSDIEVKEPFS